MDLVGKTLGNRYEILEKIGVGGMATVYKARFKLLNRNVAIKVLKDEFANDAEFIKRFQIEAQAAASLSHPNIVSIYDVGNEDNMHYIVMELIEGETLKDIITRKGKLDWREAVDIAAQIAAGLAKAHANHIIHRDIKPHNIIITKDGVAKVTDFGIAKAVSNSTINAFGSTIGSVHYFSPEHARGGYTDEKSDIYSLGVVLYEMVTGKLPFDGYTPVSVALKHIQETPKEPIEINKDIPIGVNNIIMKAMAKDISERYQSAGEMQKELERILKNPAEVTDAVVTIRKADEFPTQKIPIVGIENLNKSANEETKKIKFDEKEEIEVSKGITKKQAVIKLVVILVVAIGLFFVAFKLGSYVIGNLLVGNNNITEVPNVVGMEEEEARKTLEAKNLVMQLGVEVESEYPKGYVAKQSFSENYTLKEGASVTVNLSKGGKVVLVPNVKANGNTGVDAAKIMIEQKGLVFAREEKFDNKVPSGEIISQDPQYNEEVPVGSTVTVYVSKGVEDGLVVVPDVLGLTEEEATKLLTSKKLIAEVTTISNEAKEDGKVVSQSIEKDSVVSELTSVVIVINKLNKTDDGKKDDDKNNDNQNPVVTGKKRSIKINLSNKGERETFEVKVVLQSAAIGTRVEYEGTHTREDGIINVDVTDAKGAYLKLYIDGKLDSEQILD